MFLETAAQEVIVVFKPERHIDSECAILVANLAVIIVILLHEIKCSSLCTILFMIYKLKVR